MNTFDDVVSGRTDQDIPIADAYREVRALDAADGPVPGILARGPDGPIVLVETETVAGWPGWDLPGEHVLSVSDVARTRSGHLAVVAWCPHRLTPLWAECARSGGQAVTLAVSLLRGAAEARAGERGRGAGPPGHWWADDDGRPRFAPDTADDPGGVSAAEGAARLLEPVAGASPDRVVRRLLDRALELLEEPARLSRDGTALEAEMFTACAPQPLTFATEEEAQEEQLPVQGAFRFGRMTAWPRREAARLGDDREATGAMARHPARDERDAGKGGIRRRGAGLAARRRRRTSIIDVLGAAGRRVRAAIGPLLTGRRAAYAAAAAAACVLLVGMMWPRADGPASAGEAHGEHATAGHSPHGRADGGGRAGANATAGGDDRGADSGDGDGGAERDVSVDQENGGRPPQEDDAGDAPEGDEASDNADVPSGDPDVQESDDAIDARVRDEPASAASSLVRRAAACSERGEEDCDGVFDAEGDALGAAPWPRLVDAAPELVEDYGGAALVRISGAAAPSYYLTVVLRDGHWLLRDAYAAA